MKAKLEDVKLVWAAYTRYHPKSVLTGDRRRLIESRLRDFDVPTLVAAINGNHEDEFCNGENPRGKQYHDLGLIFRNADKIERYAGIGDTDEDGVTQQTVEQLEAWTREHAPEGFR